jgi:hypothetical protein
LEAFQSPLFSLRDKGLSGKLDFVRCTMLSAKVGSIVLDAGTPAGGACFEPMDRDVPLLSWVFRRHQPKSPVETCSLVQRRFTRVLVSE